MSSWEYRVLRETTEIHKHNEDKPTIFYTYKIIEVYYDDNNNINGWIDLPGAIADYEDLECLRGVVLKLLPRAFNKPTLVVGIDDELIELIENKS